MTWNEPGKTEKKDPWTNNSRQNNSPPDLETFFKKFLQFFASRLNFKPPSTRPPSPTTFSFVALGFFFIWLLSGIFIIQPASKGVILRFGKYIETVGPGLHWIPSFIETKQVINEQKISSYSYEALMLTRDENIVSVAIAVQYRIHNAEDYLFNVVNPQESLQQATASALRQVIGHTTLDEVLTSGREKIRQQVQTQLSSIMKAYRTGLLITDVTIQPAKAPEEVKEAFDDAIKAQEDEQRIINQAEAYAMQVEPIAKGQAQRLIIDAKAYKQQVIFRAQADTARFLALLPQSKKAPGLLRTRLYYDTLESVFSRTPKVLLTTTSSHPLFYLPLDKFNTPLSMLSSSALPATKPQEAK